MTEVSVRCRAGHPPIRGGVRGSIPRSRPRPASTVDPCLSGAGGARRRPRDGHRGPQGDAGAVRRRGRGGGRGRRRREGDVGDRRTAARHRPVRCADAGVSGLDLCREIRERDPDRKVILLSVYDDEQYLFQACGSARRDTCSRASAVTSWCASSKACRPACTAIDAGLAARAAETAARLQSDQFWPGARHGLTQRESEILSLVVTGAVQPRHRHQTGHRRGDRQDPPEFDLPQARSRRSHQRGRDGAAGGHLPVTEPGASAHRGTRSGRRRPGGRAAARHHRRHVQRARAWSRWPPRSRG